MKVFGFYREEETAVDLSLLPLLGEPNRAVLFGGGLLLLKRILGVVHGFSGFAFLYTIPEISENEIKVHLKGPVFMSEGGFFSDDPAALVGVGASLDIESCRKFIKEGDYSGFVPLLGARRYGGKAILKFSSSGLDIEIQEEGGLSVEEALKPESFTILPEIFGNLWRIKMLFMPIEVRKRAYEVERWSKGFLGVKRGDSYRTL